MVFYGIGFAKHSMNPTESGGSAVWLDHSLQWKYIFDINKRQVFNPVLRNRIWTIRLWFQDFAYLGARLGSAVLV